MSNQSIFDKREVPKCVKEQLNMRKADKEDIKN